MRRTKIICTLGPSTDGRIKEMIVAGMDVARFNFSHGTHEDHLARYSELVKAREELGRPVAAMVDTKGPEIRLLKIKDGKAFVEEGATFTFTTAEVLGDEKMCSVSYQHLPQDLTPGARILVDDGQIAFQVLEIHGSQILCKVLNSGWIKDNKGVNLPGIRISMPYISERDKNDIIFAAEHGFDFIACSFVRNAQDILGVRTILDEKKCDSIRLISKIENMEGVQNVKEILSVSDGLMVARGDMGVEIDFVEIPHLQKELIEACYTSGRPAITATQMLESMIENPRPTRAEATDIANAIYDGTSAIMLSGETAAGKHPIEAVKTMAAIAIETERHIDYVKNFQVRSSQITHLNVASAIAHAACTTVIDTSAKAIVAMTHSGETARLISKYRLGTPIIACVPTEQVFRHMALSWGVIPVLVPYAQSTDELFQQALDSAKKIGVAQDGDLVVTTAGVPVGVSGTTNMVKADIVGDALVTGTGSGTGTATGRLCVCRNATQVKKLFKKGDILVTASTSNELLPYMKDAAAIITEEIGLNSPAAIAGLALGIPVITGAIGATLNLKSGKRVIADANRGIVHSITE